MTPTELSTEKGLKYFTYGFILYIIALIVLLLMLVAFFAMASSLLEEPEERAIEDASKLFEEGDPVNVTSSLDSSSAPEIELDRYYQVNLQLTGGNYQGFLRITTNERGDYYIFMEHNNSDVNFRLLTTTGTLVDPENTDEHDSEPFEWHASYDLEGDRTYILSFGPTSHENVNMTFIQGYNPFSDEGFLASFITMIGGLCIGGLLMFIALILFLVGFISIYSGRNEFGEPHASFAYKAMIFIVVAVIINVAGGIAVSLIPGVVGGVASSVIGIITAILIALGVIFLIQELSDDSGKRMLRIAGMLYIIIAIISSILTILLFLSYGLYDISADQQAAEENLGSVIAVAMIPMAIGALQLIPIVIFLLAYRKTYSRVKSREITPILPAYPQPYPGMYPPGYPPAYAPQQPPYQPSPGYPPEQQPSAPTEAKPKPEEGKAPQEPSPGEVVQPKAVIPEQVGIMKCMFCGTQIPEGSTTCPVCKKELK